DERLVAVAQVDAAPGGRRADSAIGPAAVGQRDRRERSVLGGSHRGHRRLLASPPRAPEELASRAGSRPDPRDAKPSPAASAGEGFRGRSKGTSRALGLSRLRKEEVHKEEVEEQQRANPAV